LVVKDNSKTAAHVAVIPSVLDIVKPDNTGAKKGASCGQKASCK